MRARGKLGGLPTAQGHHSQQWLSATLSTLSISLLLPCKYPESPPRLIFVHAVPPCVTVNTLCSHPLPCQDSLVPGVRKTWMNAAVPPVPMGGTAETSLEPFTASVSQVN